MRLYSFQPETVEAERADFMAKGDVDGLTAAEVSARLFAAEPKISVLICEVTVHNDLTPNRLVVVMPGAWQSAAPLSPTMIRAADEIRAFHIAAVEILPTTFV